MVFFQTSYNKPALYVLSHCVTTSLCIILSHSASEWED